MSWDPMMNQKIMKKMYPLMINYGDGIFTDLQSFNVPWKSLEIANTLNYGYYSHSANKIVSPFVYDVAGGMEPLNQPQRQLIASTVFIMYSKKWDRLWDIYNIEYNPLFNYNLTESEQINVEEAGTSRDTGTQTRIVDTDTTNTGTDAIVVDREITNTGTDTHQISKNETDGGSESVQKSEDTANTGTDTKVTDSDSTNTGTVGNVGTSSQLDGIFGFNSSESVGKDTSDVDMSSTRTDNLAGTVDTTETETKNLREVKSGSDTHTRSLTHTASNTDTNTKNLATNEDATETETKNLAGTVDTTDTRTDNLTRTTSGESESVRSLTKSGNIGFNTPQEMLVADLELWQWNFFKSVFEDLDAILTMQVY